MNGRMTPSPRNVSTAQHTRERTLRARDEGSGSAASGLGEEIRGREVDKRGLG
jgi:hypothetical protein